MSAQPKASAYRRSVEEVTAIDRPGTRWVPISALIAVRSASRSVVGYGWCLDMVMTGPHGALAADEVDVGPDGVRLVRRERRPQVVQVVLAVAWDVLDGVRARVKAGSLPKRTIESLHCGALPRFVGPDGGGQGAGRGEERLGGLRVRVDTGVGQRDQSGPAVSRVNPLIDMATPDQAPHRRRHRGRRHRRPARHLRWR